MQEIYRFIDDAIEADRQRYTDIADQIWDHPETRFEEFWSAEHLASALESAGFTVTRNVGNIPNAFIASFGQGKPVIALLGEYDALAGLSQQAGCAQRRQYPKCLYCFVWSRQTGYRPAGRI
nr:hypothetical protein [Escherichia coli]